MIFIDEELNDKKYCVYRHTVLANHKVYIGITCQKPTKRWQHGNGYVGSMFYRAINKYGWDNIEHEILYTGLSKNEAENMEISLISLYNSTDGEYGYNISKGGEGSLGCKASPEKIERLRISHINGKQNTAIPVVCLETGKYYKNMRLAAEEYGTTSEMIKKCISIEDKSYKGFHFDYADESKRKPKKPKHIRKPTVVTERQKIARERFANSAKVPIVCLDTGEIFNSVADASRKLGIKDKRISKCLRKENFAAGGLHFDYLDESKRLPPKIAKTYENSEKKRKSIENLIRAKFKAVIAKTLDGQFVEQFESIKDASMKLGVNRSHVTECCKGLLKQTGGYIFEYAKEVS